VNKKWDLSKVSELFKSRQCTLTSSEYTNTKHKLKYIASCGHEHEITLDNFRAGKGDVCKKCRYVSIGDKQSLSQALVADYFKEHGCILIGKYTKNNLKVEYIAQCGHKNKVSFGKFQQGIGRTCLRCSKAVRYEYEYVFDSFVNEECYLLETEYINCRTPMKYIAKCGHEAYTTFDMFKNSKSISKKCAKCQDSNSYTYEDIKVLLEKEKCTLLSKEYIVGVPLEYVAQCGHIKHTQLLKFNQGQGRMCSKCARPKGEQHHRYNSSLTDEDRFKNRDLWESKQWRIAVYDKDKYTCQKCGDSKGNNLNAHHISGWNIDKDKRFDVSNGITLCKECHNDFHVRNGYGNNTESQFLKWFDANTEIKHIVKDVAHRNA